MKKKLFVLLPLLSLMACSGSKKEDPKPSPSGEPISSQIIPTSESEDVMILEGHTFIYESCVEGEDSLEYSPEGMTVEFIKGGQVELTQVMPGSIYGLEEDVSVKALGTYVQDGKDFTYSLTGIEVFGEYQPYPSTMLEAYTNRPGSIEGNKITMELNSGHGGPEGVQITYYHVVMALVK